jgi:molecular chaperone Hsp33
MNTDAPQGPDLIQRAMTDDGAFRVVTVRCTTTVSGVLQAQRASGPTARYLGDLVTGAILIRETMSPSLRVQGILKLHKAPGYLLSDSHPSGRARGLIGGKAREAENLEGSVLQIMRTLQDGRVHQGVVSVPDGGDVSQALMVYMQESEQITTMIVVETLLENDQVCGAGGYLVQLLPGAATGPLAVMTERLEDFRTLDPFLKAPDFSPTSLMSELLYGMPYTELDETPLRYGCWCSRTSVLGALASLQRREVQDMVDAGDVLEISCDYCTRDYRVTPTELRGLLEQN